MPSTPLRVIYDRRTGQTSVDFRDLLLFVREFSDGLGSDLDYTTPPETRHRVADQRGAVDALVAALTRVHTDALRANGVAAS